MIILRQREFSLKDDLKEALKDGDTEKIKKLEKKTTRTGRLIGAGTGLGLAGARSYQTRGLIKDLYKKNYGGFKDIGLNDRQSKAATSGTLAGAYGILGGASAGIGTGIGHAIGKARFNRAMKKAKEELKREK